MSSQDDSPLRELGRDLVRGAKDKLTDIRDLAIAGATGDPITPIDILSGARAFRRALQRDAEEKNREREGK